MKRTQHDSGVLFIYPDPYRPTTRRRAAPARGARGPLEEAIPDDDAIDQALDPAFAELGLEVVDELTLAAPQGARSLRGVPSSEQFVGVEVDVGEGESAAVLVEQDGVYSWVFPAGAVGRRGIRRTTVQREERLVFQVPLTRAGASDQRGLISWGGAIAGWVKTKVVKFAAELAVSGATKILERNVERGIVVMDGLDASKWRRVPDMSYVEFPENGTGRFLLFVHGTFSNTVNSFQALTLGSEGRRLLEEMRGEGGPYDAIVGFDHPTLSETPLDNALELARLLEARDWKKAPLFDAVSYSRGGMVLRSLTEMVLPQSNLRRQHPGARCETGLLVGATNAGTELASPQNWHDLIDVYTNLAVGTARVLSLAPGVPGIVGLLGEGLSGLASFVKYLATEAIDRRGVPGLAAMDPDGEFVRQLNQRQPNQPGSGDISYHAVISDFEAGGRRRGLGGELPKRLARALADRVVDQLMGERNDLVVNTRSMVSIDRESDELLKSLLDYGTNGSVYHTVYFTQDRTVDAMRQWLGVRKRRQLRGATAADEAEETFPQFAAEIVAPRAVDREPPARTLTPPPERPRLEIEVVWGDITKAAGDVYAVGHYRGVLPQKAELALDGVISDVSEPWNPEAAEELVLTQMTKRNQIRGDLGDIQVFPWGDGDGVGRLVAVCGMGFLGSFDESSLRRLHRGLAWSILTLPQNRSLSTVLIGAGEGNLTVEAAVKGTVLGFADALQSSGHGGLERVRIVEIYQGRAEQIQRIVSELADEDLPIELVVKEEPRRGDGRRVEDELWLELLIEAATKADANADLEQLIAEIPSRKYPKRVTDAIRWLWKKHELDDGVGGVAALAGKLRREQEEGGKKDDTVRLSFFREGSRIMAAAIALQGATIPQRVIELDPTLIDEAARRMTDPDPREMQDLARLLHGLVLPRDFRPLVERDFKFVVEVDRNTAPIHWEMLARNTVQAQIDSQYRPEEGSHLGLEAQVVRQLRTTYSPPPNLQRFRRGEGLTALVIGDPGDPEKGHSLDGARTEARVVERILRQSNQFASVRVMIGAPRDDGGGSEPGIPPATRIDVLRTLMNEPIDLIHYAGHGDFDPQDPSVTGWVFKDGLLTARELARIDRVPPVVVANACLTARTSQRSASGWLGSTVEPVRRLGQEPFGRPTKPPSEVGLLPSLADEFFRRGVLNYIGTAWQVSDMGAVDFAKGFYAGFLDQGDELGAVMLEVRQALFKAQDGYGALWAAYQHYGDPTFKVTDI